LNDKRPLVVQYVFNKAIQQHRRHPPAIYKSNMATYSITQEQLQSILDQHVEKLLGAGLIKKGKSAGKSISKKSASSSGAKDASDSASEAGSTRSVGEGTKAWNDLTKIVSSLVKEALAGEKGGAGFHFKVLSYLKTEKGLKTGESPSLDMVKEAVSFLKSNPEFKSPNQKNKAEKKASLPSEEKEEAEAEAPAPEEKKKPGRPKKSDEEKEAAKAAKKAEKETAAASKKAEKVAEKATKKTEKVEKKTEAKKAAPVPKKAPEPVEEDSEEDEVEMCAFEFDGQQLFWNESTGEAFENIEGALGDLVGTFDGITLTPA
jgi:hypothetical protein